MRDRNYPSDLVHESKTRTWKYYLIRVDTDSHYLVQDLVAIVVQ